MTRRVVLNWRQVMAAHEETERRLLQLLRMPLSDDAKQKVRDIAADVVVPVLRRDGRKLSGRWERRPGFQWQRRS